MCLRFQFCTHQRVCILQFLKISQIRCNLMYIYVEGGTYPSRLKALRRCRCSCRYSDPDSLAQRRRRGAASSRSPAWSWRGSARWGLQCGAPSCSDRRCDSWTQTNWNLQCFRSGLDPDSIRWGTPLHPVCPPTPRVLRTSLVAMAGRGQGLPWTCPKKSS